MKLTPMPAAETRYDRYTVTLNGQPADVLTARVSAVPYNWGWPGHQRPLDQTELSGFVTCQSNGPVEVCVTVADTAAEPVVRPLNRHVAVTMDGLTARFTLPGPGQYSFEPDDFHCVLQLFVSPEYTLPAAEGDTLYYGPGVHEVGDVILTSGQTVIVDDGAVVYGSFTAYYEDNITVTGGGIIDGSREVRESGCWLLPLAHKNDEYYDGYNYAERPEDLKEFLSDGKMLNGCLRFYGCTNVRVSHVICRDAATFHIIPAACENVTFDDVKIVGSWRYNSDGIDLFNCTNVVIRNCFLRNFDDCVVIKGIYGWHTRPNSNILVENCVIWCDWGRAIEIGAETCATEYSNIIARDCDIIHGNWLQLDIQHHNFAEIHDLTFENIRCEYTRHQLPMKMQEREDQPYEEAPAIFPQPALLGAFFYDRGLFGPGHGTDSIRRILFKDIQVLSDEEVPMPACQFVGLNDTCCVDGVRIENLTRNGVKCTTPEEAHLECAEYVKNVEIV